MSDRFQKPFIDRPGILDAIPGDPQGYVTISSQTYSSGGGEVGGDGANSTSGAGGRSGISISATGVQSRNLGGAQGGYAVAGGGGHPILFSSLFTIHKGIFDKLRPYVRYSPARCWDEVTWIARRVYMSQEDGIKRMGKMKELDLHGIFHRDVRDKVENFVLLHSTELPIRIITGDSYRMRNLTVNILNKHKFTYDIPAHNPGEIIVLS